MQIKKKSTTRSKNMEKNGENVYISTLLEAYLNSCLPHEVLFFLVIAKRERKASGINIYI